MINIVSGVITVAFVLLLLAWLASISGFLAGGVVVLIVSLFVGKVVGSVWETIQSFRDSSFGDGYHDEGEGSRREENQWRQEPEKLRARPYVGGEEEADGRRIVVDTETTGFGRRSEVLEVAIIDADTGEVLYDTPVLPAGPIQSAASAVHGLTRTELKRLGAEPWPAHHEVVAQIIYEAGLVLAYNADFDRRLLEQTAERYGFDLPAADWRCIMRGYAQNRRSLTLSEACRREGITAGGHRAVGDARVARELVLCMDWRRREATEQSDTDCDGTVIT